MGPSGAFYSEDTGGGGCTTVVQWHTGTRPCRIIYWAQHSLVMMSAMPQSRSSSYNNAMATARAAVQ